MESDNRDDVIEITDKNYQKLSQIFEKEGFREGKSDGCDSIFQKSFDLGYEDGFKIGLILGRRKEDKAKSGRCDMCKNKELLKKSEHELREIVQNTYENVLKEAD